jgi:creatinine amidohydrolase
LSNRLGGMVRVRDGGARARGARLDMLVYSVSWFNLPLMDAQGRDVNALFSAEEHRFGIHGGDIETSMMLALDPTRVDMAQARNFASKAQARASQFEILGNGKSARLGWQTQDYHPAGAVGDAASATAAKGQALVDAAGLALARLLTEVDRLPADTLLSRPVPG